MINKVKIYFLENSFNYNGSNLNSAEIGGSEKTLINISTELAKDKDLIVKVFNNTSDAKKINNVFWNNLKRIDKLDIPDFLISMSDVNLFNYLSCDNNFLWSHSIQSIEKFIRKKQLISFFKYKPIMILEGDYHYQKRNFFTSFFGKRVLKIAPDYDFINTKVDINKIPPPDAIFTTKSDRNLHLLISAWHQIKKKCKNSKLFINPPYKLNEVEINDDIFIRKKSDKNQLIEKLLNVKIFITPGHKTEVFCLAAEEARELCLPIVTMGFGCLYERVEHGVTGFLAKNQKDFIEYSSLILNDDSVYLEIKKNLFNKKNSRNYKHVKDDLIKILRKK